MRRDKKGVMVTNANVKVSGARDGLQSTCGREYKREREEERERESKIVRIIMRICCV